MDISSCRNRNHPSYASRRNRHFKSGISVKLFNPISSFLLQNIL